MFQMILKAVIRIFGPKRDDPKRTTPAPSAGATPPSPGPKRDDPK